MQKDLFGGAGAGVLPSQTESKADFLQKHTLVLRLDQAIIAVLALLVAYVLVFSFGVESGKRFAMAEIKAERGMRERMARELGEKIFANSAASTAVPSAVSNLNVSTAGASVTVKKTDASAILTPVGPAVVAQPNQSSGKYAVQTVTFTSKSAAEKHLTLLSSKGYQGTIITRGKFQQVCVAGFETKEKALAAMARLKADDLAPKDAYIRTIA